MGDAVFFDLDRTLLRGASGPVFTEMLKAVGVVPDRSIPGEGFVYRLFDVIGETLPSMLLTRQAARVASGWQRASVQEAGRQAAERLVGQVPAGAKELIEQHRRAGRPVVMATTSPYDLVKPLADELGMEGLLATRYGERDGAYDGSIAGHFVWGPGKLAAVREWAAEHDVDVASSWAYSDSIYDTPLLSAVGNPVVVNPDPRLRVLAAARRWPVASFDDVAPAGEPTVPGVQAPPTLQNIIRRQVVPYARFDIAGTERIPRRGPVILVANHRSYFDSMTVAFIVAEVGRTVRFLGKKEVFDVPVVGQMAKLAGGIRVDRGTGSDEPLQAASDALADGDAVMLMPEGTIPRGKAFFDPELKGRWGAARLAAMSRAPVIPIGLWGTEKVWPRSSRLPNVLNLRNPPTVRVRVGHPVPLEYDSPDADTKRIMAAITALLPPEASVRRDPSPEELALTLPPGYHGDLDAEEARRPGTD